MKVAGVAWQSLMGDYLHQQSPPWDFAYAKPVSLLTRRNDQATYLLQ